MNIDLKKIDGQHSHWRANKEIVKLVRGDAAILFSYLIDCDVNIDYKIEKDGDEWFYRTSEKIKEETCFSYDIQKSCIEKLESHGLIKTKLMGVPRKLYFSICVMNYLKVMSLNREIPDTDLPKSQNSSWENPKAVSGKSPELYLGKSQLYIDKNKEKEIKNEEESNSSISISNNLPANFISGTKKDNLHDTNNAAAANNSIGYIGKSAKTREKDVNLLRDLFRKKYKDEFDVLCEKMEATVPEILSAFVDYFVDGKGRAIDKNNHAGLFSSFRQWMGFTEKTGEKVKVENKSELGGQEIKEIDKLMSGRGHKMGTQDKLELKEILDSGYFAIEDWKDMIRNMNYDSLSYKNLIVVAKSRLKNGIRLAEWGQI